jgi:hypothetical protein
MKMPEDLPITAEDWEKTPTSVQALLSLLWSKSINAREGIGSYQRSAVSFQLKTQYSVLG